MLERRRFTGTPGEIADQIHDEVSLPEHGSYFDGLKADYARRNWVKAKFIDTPTLRLAMVKRNEGLAKLTQAQVTEFAGYTESPFNQEYNIALLWELTDQFKVGIYQRLRSIEGRTGIKFYLAGRDAPLHSTVQAAKFDEEDAGLRDRKFKDLANDLRLTRCAQLLNGGRFEFGYLGALGDNLVLTALSIPASIHEVRTNSQKVYKDRGLQPKMLDLFHITLARISEVPSETSQSAINSYVDEMDELKYEIWKKPLSVVAKAVSCPAASMIQDAWRKNWSNSAPPPIDFARVSQS
jgi:hypothetical protein